MGATNDNRDHRYTNPSRTVSRGREIAKLPSRDNLTGCFPSLGLDNIESELDVLALVARLSVFSAIIITVGASRPAQHNTRMI